MKSGDLVKDLDGNVARIEWIRSRDEVEGIPGVCLLGNAVKLEGQDFYWYDFDLEPVEEKI